MPFPNTSGSQRRRDVRCVTRRNRLVERHLFLVGAVAHRLTRSMPPCVEFDELLADGAIGLLRAAIRFDASRGVPFPRFATRHIRGAMIDAARRRRRAPLPLGNCEVASVDNGFDRVDHQLDARSLVAREPHARRRLVVVLYFFDQITMKRIGRTLGVSEARVSQLIRRSLDTLRTRAKNNPADGEPAGCCISPLIRRITDKIR